ncbi:hypothetical protein JQ537_002332 [Listeria monocytogenes]|nr:hypothetical protein [Listeria monocytogenes]
MKRVGFYFIDTDDDATSACPECGRFNTNNSALAVLECIKINQPVYVQKEASERRAASSAKKEFAKELQNLINNHKGNLSKATVLNYIEQIEDVGIGIYS